MSKDTPRMNLTDLVEYVEDAKQNYFDAEVAIAFNGDCWSMTLVGKAKKTGNVVAVGSDIKRGDVFE